MSRNFDAIIIGTGQAGPSLAARFSAAGMTVAIIERQKFGGTCVNTGCIPTKTLVASAYAAHLARRGAEFGFVVDGDVPVDMKRVKARKDEISGRANSGVEEWLRGLKNCTVIQGHARFESSRSVVVNDEVLEAEKIFINIGGRATVPAFPGIHDVPFFTNSQLCELFKDPKQNGNRTVEQIVEHMQSPLVLWAWSPGEGRSPVPMPQHEFMEKVKAWASNGAACPVDASITRPSGD